MSLDSSNSKFGIISNKFRGEKKGNWVSLRHQLSSKCCRWVDNHTINDILTLTFCFQFSAFFAVQKLSSFHVIFDRNDINHLKFITRLCKKLFPWKYLYLLHNLHSPQSSTYMWKWVFVDVIFWVSIHGRLDIVEMRPMHTWETWHLLEAEWSWIIFIYSQIWDFFRLFLGLVYRWLPNRQTKYLKYFRTIEEFYSNLNFEIQIVSMFGIRRNLIFHE